MATVFDLFGKYLERHPDLLWTSESDFPLVAERHPPAYFDTWQKNTTRETLSLLANAPEGEEWETLLDFFTRGHELVSYRKPSGKPAEFNLFLGWRTNFSVEGFATKVVET